MISRHIADVTAGLGAAADRREAERSEADRRGAAAPSQTAAAIPDPEAEARPKRRTFSADYKRRILAEIAAATQPGASAAILRREGLYSSTLTTWRRERDRAVAAAFAKRRGPRPGRNPLAAENEKLRRQNQRLEQELRKAELIIEVQKKVARLLDPRGSGIPGEEP